MSRARRPEQRPGDRVDVPVRSDASPEAAPGPFLPPQALRDAQRAAVDLLIFAPIGFAKRARSLLPDLIREGRSTAASAKTIGKFVTPIVRKQGTKLVKAKVAELTRSTTAKHLSSPAPLPESAGPSPDGTSGPKAKVARKRPPGRVESSPKESSPKESSPVESSPVESSLKESSPVESSLKESSPKESSPKESSPKESSMLREPFPGYDRLGSAAVVARLVELSKAERAAVGAYETSKRNRRTVLGRLDQLDPSR